MRYLIILAMLAGCANVTTMKIKQNKDGSISIDSGKDVRMGQLYFKRGDEEVFVLDYSSAANTDVINAQSTREIGTINAIKDAILSAVQAGIAAAGKAVVP